MKTEPEDPLSYSHGSFRLVVVSNSYGTSERCTFISETPNCVGLRTFRNWLVTPGVRKRSRHRTASIHTEGGSTALSTGVPPSVPDTLTEGVASVLGVGLPAVGSAVHYGGARVDTDTRRGRGRVEGVLPRIF